MGILNLGCSNSQYKAIFEKMRQTVKTLDIDKNQNADFVGTVKNTNLSDNQFDLVICTQVLEHCDDPFRGMNEINRILKTNGYLIASASHVWFYHSHSKDHWRFTQESILKLYNDVSLRPLKLLAQCVSLNTSLQIMNFLIHGVL